MDVWGETKYQGPCGMDQKCSWTFCIKLDIKDLSVWTNVFMDVLNRTKCPARFSLCLMGWPLYFPRSGFHVKGSGHLVLKLQNPATYCHSMTFIYTVKLQSILLDYVHSIFTFFVKIHKKKLARYITTN